MTDDLKSAVTVSEMARMLGMSRSRIYQLLGKAFPQPSRDENGRPYFNEEQQRLILDVRHRNCGIDGKPILFYAPRHSISRPTPRRSPTSKSTPINQHAAIIDGVKTLGITSVTATQVEQAIKKSFPSGIVGVDPGELIRAVFLCIKCQDSEHKPKR